MIDGFGSKDRLTDRDGMTYACDLFQNRCPLVDVVQQTRIFAERELVDDIPLPTN